MNRRKVGAAALVAGFAMIAAFGGLLLTSQEAQAQTRRFFAFHINTSDNNNAALQVNQRGTGNILALQDNGSNTFTVADGGAVTVAGAVALSGGATGALDLNGLDLTFDADADTIATETTDDIVTLTSGAATGLWNILTGNLKVGNGTPGVSMDGEDAYVEGTLEVDGAVQLDGAVVNASTTQLVGAVNLDGAVDLDGVVTNADGLEHRMMETYATQAFTWTASSGGTVTLFTVGASEQWYVRSLLIEVTTNFDATGDDVTLDIGDGNDADGFCVLVDAELQTADTEGTGFAAGWQCQVAATRGVYQDGTGGFMYDGTDTIDAVIAETSGATITAGAATAHIWYTRID